MKRSGHVPGAPCWVELVGPDPKDAADFYSGFFGWEAVPWPATGAGDEGEDRALFTLGGRPVAALGTPTGPGTEPRWTVHVRVTDVDAVPAAVRSAGGTVRDGPSDVPGFGRSARCADPGGGEFAVWQPGPFRGAEVLDEPGSLCWIELNTRDDRAALGFYGSVFGWSGEPRPFGGSSYTELEVAGRARPFGAVMRMSEAWPPGTPQHWTVYFEVADCDAAAARTGELGGRVSIAPFDLENVGRIAVVEDASGASFSVISTNRAA